MLHVLLVTVKKLTVDKVANLGVLLLDALAGHIAGQVARDGTRHLLDDVRG
jgi:hypothetical protein